MLVVQNVSFGYLQNKVIHHIDFSVQKGENIAILGESGCGKSTLLQLIYGLHNVEEGQIFCNNVEVLGPKFNLIPGMENMKYLPQNFDLMPYISVSENIGKYLSNTNPIQKQERIQELLEIVEMTQYAHTKPQFLSGGQQQRVAIARVLALEPEVLLLDEPFSHIDNFRKNALRRNLFLYLKNKGITCIVATHDSTDALSFSDQTIVIKNGSIVQKDTPSEIYNNPTNKYVGSLFGEINEIKKSIFYPEVDNEELILCYPHQLKISENGLLKANVRKSYYKGSNYLIKAVYNKNIVFFEHFTNLIFNEEVSLDICYDFDLLKTI